MVSRFRAFVAGGVSLTVAGLVIFAVYSGIGDSWWTIKDRYIFDRHFGDVPVNRYYEGYSAVAWSPDGKWIATAKRTGGIRILDSVSGGMRYSYQDREGFYSMEWSPHGNKLLWGCDDQLKIWDVKNDNNPAVYTYLDNASAVAWSPDGEKIAVCNYYSWNYTYITTGNYTHTVTLLNCTLFVYALENGSILLNVSIPYLESKWPFIDWFPDGSKIIGWLEGEIYIWNATDGNKYLSYPTDAWIPPSPSPDGKWLATSSGLLNIENGPNKTYWTIIYKNPASWSHDGKKLATGDRQCLAIYNVTKKIENWHNPPGFFLDGEYADYPCLAWSPDNRQIIITTQDEGIDIIALDSDADGIPDYRDVLPTVNYKLELLFLLCAMAAVAWTVVLAYLRIRRKEEVRSRP